MRKWILALILMLLIVALGAGVAINRPLVLGDDGILRNPPLCQMDGQRVYYYKSPQEHIWDSGGGLAMAVIDGKGIPWIIIDNDNFSLFSVPFQFWMMRHECHHHLMGHTRLNPQQAIGDGNKNERETDCGAIDDMVKFGFTNKQFDQLFADMVNRELLSKALGGVQETEFTQVSHSWTPEERMEHNKQCLMISRSKYSVTTNVSAVETQN